jgi:uncharacterized membrane protein
MPPIAIMILGVLAILAGLISIFLVPSAIRQVRNGLDREKLSDPIEDHDGKYGIPRLSSQKRE